jgi:hypothetical protein
MKMPEQKILELIDEALELVELHVRNSLNMCLCGGMASILDIIFNNPSDKARSEACGLFSFSN